MALDFSKLQSKLKAQLEARFDALKATALDQAEDTSKETALAVLDWLGEGLGGGNPLVDSAVSFLKSKVMEQLDKIDGQPG